MNKNLKKVISAVIALALSVSSVAMAATGFTDVAETASYAQAVNTLAALDIIAGYEDGSFKPDANITRAEVATMVVAALDRTADAEGSKGTTPFADVNTDAKAWATGFVNIGVEEGFISGYEDGTFKPDNNVTYAEIVSMLVRAAGYEKLAQYLGGWSTGYLTVGKDYGITTGVAAAADKAVTRAQVAQLLYNTLLNTPAVENSTLTTDIYGNLVPEMTIMDGKNGREFKTMLTEKHNAYYVEGIVSKTNKTNPTTYTADEVEFTIQYTENYNDSEYVIKKGATEVVSSVTVPMVRPVDVLVGDTEAANYLNTYSSAIIKVEEDDATIVSFVPSGKNDVIAFDATLLDTADYAAAAGVVGTNSVYGASATGTSTPVATAYVRYYASKDASKSTKYLLDPTFTLYVNGIAVPNTKANFDAYVVGNTTGKVEFTDSYSSGAKKDGKYDMISVTYYATAEVGSVSTSTGKVTFNEAYNNGLDRYIVLDAEDDTLTYNIYYNGEEIDVADLLEDDIISIAYDVTGTLGASNFYDIYVSRDTATGRLTGKDAVDGVVTIGGADYELVRGYGAASSMVLADEYTLALDAFGRIFSFETSATSAKLAILDKYTKQSGDDYYTAVLYTLDGSVITAEVDATKVSQNNTTDFATAGVVDSTISGYVYVDLDAPGAADGIQDDERISSNKNALTSRVVEYKLSSSTGRIVALDKKTNQKVATSQSYKAETGALGSIKMNDATVVIDACGYSETNTYDSLAIGSLASTFTSTGSYTAQAFGDKTASGTYPMVIVTSAGGSYTYETSLAVIAKTPVLAYDDAAEASVYKVEMLYNGEEYTDDAAMIANDDVVVNGATIATLAKGDIVVFEKDGNGNIKKIDVVKTATSFGLTSYSAVATALFANNTANTGAATIPGSANNWTTYWYNLSSAPSLNTAKEVSQIVYGPIVGKNNNYFQIGSIATDPTVGGTVTLTKLTSSDLPASYTGKYTDLSKEVADAGAFGGVMEIDIDDNTKVYVYDYSITNANKQLTIGFASDIVATPIADSLLYNDGDIIPWDVAGVKDGANFAFAKVVDGTATDVFVILAN